MHKKTTLTSWNERKEVFFVKAGLVVEEFKHRRGRRPKALTDMQRLLSDADLRCQIKAITFAELESKFDFWL